MKYSLRHQISHLALLVALAGAASAQTEGDYDAFGIVDDNIPLNQLVPQDDTLPPPQTFLNDDPDAGADTAIAPVPDISMAQTVLAPVVAQDTTPTLPQVANFAPPADWLPHEINGVSFSAPSNWKVVQEDSDGIMLFGGDMDTRSGPSFGLLFDRKTMLDDDEVEILSEAEYLLADGSQYKRIEARAELAGGSVELRAIAFLSPDTNEDDKYTILMMATYNADFEDHKEMLEQILGTVKTSVIAPKARSETLDGLVSYVVPKSWRIHNSSDGEFVSFATKYYSGYIAIATAGRVAAEQGMDDDVVADATSPQPSRIFGQEAMLQTWQSDAEFFVGTSMVSGQYSYYRLNKCLPNGAPIGVILAGAPEFFESDEFAEAMAGIALSLPQDVEDCAGPAVTALEPAPRSERDQSMEMADTSQPETRPQIENITNVDVQGAQFALPQGWTVLSDSPSDKMFTSPDGRFTILAFWWFPDEPLTGSEGDISVKQVVNDHEPSTRITSKIGQLSAIMNVTERARVDEKRFIFTVEGSNVSLAELNALHDTLILSLQFNGPFDPEGARVATQNRAGPVAPAQLATVQPAQSTPTWEVYENTRFGTRVSYPSNLFRAKAPPANNDGRSFEGIGGSHEFIVFGQHNIDGLGVRGLIEQDISWGGYDAVTYEKSGDGWYVLSGYKGANIFYRKVFLDEQSETLHVLEITYPSALKREFDAVVVEMASSFAMASVRPAAVTQPTADSDNERPQMTRRNKEEYTATKK